MCSIDSRGAAARVDARIVKFRAAAALLRNSREKANVITFAFLPRAVEIRTAELNIHVAGETIEALGTQHPRAPLPSSFSLSLFFHYYSRAPLTARARLHLARITGMDATRLQSRER